jgi:hypothetical protein
VCYYQQQTDYDSQHYKTPVIFAKQCNIAEKMVYYCARIPHVVPLPHLQIQSAKADASKMGTQM